MTVALVLAAGLGTRLRPLTDTLPKPLVPLGDRPMIARVVGDLRSAGLSRIVANAFHHREAIAGWAEAAGVFVSNEEELLGTAGGLARARPLLGVDDVLVYNGDILAQLDLRALAASLRGEAVLAVRPRGPGEGNVGVDADGRVVRLRAERFAAEVQGGDFLGIHVLSRGLVATLPAAGCLVGDVYLPALARGARIHAFEARQPFADVGTLAAYLEANLEWLAGRSAFVGDGASVASSVLLKRTIVGHGARVAGEGALEECVVWPGATAIAPLRRAIVTSRGVVSVP